MSASAPRLGGKGGNVKLDAEVFEAAFNEALVHECVIAEQAARRRGTAATRTRGMVRGGGAKPWRQKGTGRARAGSSRSPLWAGGGTVFGPSPRSYTVKVNRKARRAALRSALSVHAARGSLAVLHAPDFTEPSTSQAAGLLGAWTQRRRSTLLLVGEGEQAAAKSFRNLGDVTVLEVQGAGVAEIMRYAGLLSTDAALEALVARARRERVAVAVANETPTSAEEA
ncbi:MAG: 50S ribosomal protein L4 [Solirubrobacteraceae bacterium]|nr:MAG: 50S ribosomal protein L4 [Solirubrobacterales bacterium]